VNEYSARLDTSLLTALLESTGGCRTPCILLTKTRKDYIKNQQKKAKRAQKCERRLYWVQELIIYISGKIGRKIGRNTQFKRAKEITDEIETEGAAS
jgi:hypothetical protein